MFTIAETEIFSATWPKYWTPEEFGDFCAWLALNPEAGDVIPRSGGCRKVRWVVEGRGKRDRRVRAGKLPALVELVPAAAAVATPLDLTAV